MENIEHHTEQNGTTDARGRALSLERAGCDTGLLRERALVDRAIAEIEGDTRHTHDMRNFMAHLRGHIQTLRQSSDGAAVESRERTDHSVRDDHVLQDTIQAASTAKLTDSDRRLRKAASQLRREHVARTSAEEALGKERLDASQGLWGIRAEVQAIAAASAMIYSLPRGPTSDETVAGLADAIRVAADRVLEILENTLDPEDNRGRYHDSGVSG